MNKVSKGLIVTAVVFGVIVSCSSFAKAASLSGIGFIDVQKVFKEYKEATKAQEQVAKDEAAFKKEFEESQKKIEDAKTAKKSDKDIEKMTKDLEGKLNPKRDKLIQLNQTLTAKLQKDIIDATKEVKKSLGIDVVLDKQVIIDGGQDVTDMVITKLNK